MFSGHDDAHYRRDLSDACRWPRLNATRDHLGQDIWELTLKRVELASEASDLVAVLRWWAGHSVVLVCSLRSSMESVESDGSRVR